MKILWKYLFPHIDALITRRLILFHKALVERNQISVITPPTVTKED
jgi:hypothetical protein